MCDFLGHLGTSPVLDPMAGGCVRVEVAKSVLRVELIALGGSIRIINPLLICRETVMKM